MPTKSEDPRKPADAKLFWNGRSQAVRLPKEFRFEGDRVRVRRVGAGVLLEPIPGGKKETAGEWLAGSDALKDGRMFRDDRKGTDLVEAMQASPYKETSLGGDRVRIPVREVGF